MGWDSVVYPGFWQGRGYKWDQTPAQPPSHTLLRNRLRSLGSQQGGTVESTGKRKFLFPLGLGWLLQCDTFTNVGENAVGPQGEENTFASFGDGVKDREHLGDALRPCFDLSAGLWCHHRAELTGTAPGHGLTQARGSCDSGC